jgi:hypothetical protein
MLKEYAMTFTVATRQQETLDREALRPAWDNAEARRAELRHAKIARLAYYIWQVRGEQSGCSEINWLIAEHVFETGRFLGGGTDTC